MFNLNFIKLVFLMLITCFACVGFCEEPNISLSINQKLAALDAEKLGKKAVIEKYPDEFRNLACVLVRETQSEYFITCGEYGEIPAPGSEYLIVFDKTTGQLTIIPGQ